MIKKMKKMFNLKGSKSTKMKKKTPTTIWTPSQRRGNVDIPTPITKTNKARPLPWETFIVRQLYIKLEDFLWKPRILTKTVSRLHFDSLYNDKLIISINVFIARPIHAKKKKKIQVSSVNGQDGNVTCLILETYISFVYRKIIRYWNASWNKQCLTKYKSQNK